MTNRSSTFDLFTKLRMEKTDLETNPKAPNGSLIPYYMTNGANPGREPWCYNDITRWGKGYAQVKAQSQRNDPFDMSTDDSIPPKYVEQPRSSLFYI